MAYLKPAQVKAAILLAEGNRCKDVAKEIGVTQETISHWNGNAEFLATVNRLKLEALEAARAKLRNAATTAADVLVTLASGSKSDEVRRKAATDIIRVCGLEPGDQQAYATDIGGTTPEAVEREMASKKQMEALLESLGSR